MQRKFSDLLTGTWNKGDEITSRELADGLKMEHRRFILHIDKYEDELMRDEMSLSEISQLMPSGQIRRNVYLNHTQALLLILLLRPKKGPVFDSQKTIIVRACEAMQLQLVGA